MNLDKLKNMAAIIAFSCFPFAIATAPTAEARFWLAFTCFSFSVFVYVTRKN